MRPKYTYHRHGALIFLTGLQSSHSIKILFLRENVVLSNTENVIEQLMIKYWGCTRCQPRKHRDINQRLNVTGQVRQQNTQQALWEHKGGISDRASASSDGLQGVFPVSFGKVHKMSPSPNRKSIKCLHSPIMTACACGVFLHSIRETVYIQQT